MLDPLTAIGLASAIVQLVDFGSRLISTGHDVAKSGVGATQRNIEITQLTTDLQQISGGLRVTQSAFGLPSADDRLLLQNLATQSFNVSQDLLKLLAGLKINSNGKYRTWEVLRQTVRSVWNAEKIEKLHAQLEAIRSHINTRLLIIIKDQQSDIHRSIYQLIQLTEKSQEANIKHIDQLHAELMVELDQHETKLQRAIARVVANTPGLDASKYPVISPQNEQRIEDLKAEYDLDNFDTLSQRLSPLAEAGRSLAVAENILESLVYPELHLRHDRIPDAHVRTLEWLVHDEDTVFKTWLRKPGGIFWMNGKAGSGKSTAMKFVADHELTRTVLKAANASKKLVIVSFYFWSSGHPLQRSQEGLLQSLTFQLLRQCPDLIPLVCPTRWQSESGLQQREPWRRSELSAALQAIVRQSQLPACFCFFVDGMDEYDGDHYDLIQDFERLASSSSIKICVSSRPWNVFRTHYGGPGNDQLVIEELTKGDMERYVQDLLENDKRFARLSSSDNRAVKLVEEVRERANGVFLWVFLVIRSLLRGLTEQDDIEMLIKRLRSLPPDLESFFQRMLDSVDQVYRVYTARALQLMVHAVQPLPLLMFWFLPSDVDDPEFVYARQITTPPLGHALGDATAYINKWCRDLLEVRHTKEATLRQDASLLAAQKVEFLHRTVKDFLETKDIQALLLDRTGENFEPWSSLCRLHLAQARIVDYSLDAQVGIRVFTDFAWSTMFYAKGVEVKTGDSPYKLLQLLNKTGEEYFPEYLNFNRKGASCHWPDIQHKDNLAYERRANDDRLTFTALAVMFDLQLYLSTILDGVSGPVAKNETALLHFALKRRYQHPLLHDRDFPKLDMIRLLLRHGIRADQVMEGAENRRTVWHQFMLDAEPNKQGNNEALVAADLMRGSGPDAKVEVPKLAQMSISQPQDPPMPKPSSVPLLALTTPPPEKKRLRTRLKSLLSR